MILSYESEKRRFFEEKEWTNQDNNSFYQVIKASGLEKLAINAGLNTGCDIELLSPYWQNCQSILEIGAGYGRVIEYLLNQNFPGQITAIERCDAMFNYLQKNYSHNDKINLIHSDIYDINEKVIQSNGFDLMFWLWSGIADFSLEEQPLMLRKLKGFLKKGGKLIFDTVADTAIPLGTEEKDLRTEYTLRINDATIRMYRASINQLKKYAEVAGFSTLRHIVYKTQTQRDRTLHILS